MVIADLSDMKENPLFGLNPDSSEELLSEPKVSIRQRINSWLAWALFPIMNRETHMKRAASRFHIEKLTEPLIPEELNLLKTGEEITSVNIPNTTIPLVQRGDQGVSLEIYLLELDKLDAGKIRLSNN